jgi:hypothetical protein
MHHAVPIAPRALLPLRANNRCSGYLKPHWKVMRVLATRIRNSATEIPEFGFSLRNPGFSFRQ